MKIRFEFDYGLALGKVLNIPLCVVTARSVFEENGKYYPQVYLEDCFLSAFMQIILMFASKLL